MPVPVGKGDRRVRVTVSFVMSLTAHKRREEARELGRDPGVSLSSSPPEDLDAAPIDGVVVDGPRPSKQLSGPTHRSDGGGASAARRSNPSSNQPPPFTVDVSTVAS